MKEHASRKSSTTDCQNCGARLPLREDSELVVCEYCGTRWRYAQDSDTVRIERIRARAFRDVEVERIRQEQLRIERQYRRSLFRFLALPLVLIAALLCIYSLTEGQFRGFLVALMMLALFMLSYLLGAQVIRNRRGALSVLPALLGILLIFPFVFVHMEDEQPRQFKLTEWSDVLLSKQLPVPPNKMMNLIVNSRDYLYLEVQDVSTRQHLAYVEALKELGYSVEARESSLSYNAYDQAGYHVALLSPYEQSAMSISLTAPEQFGELRWPTGKLAAMLPVPAGSQGKLLRDETDSLYVKVAGTTLEDLSAYVDACILEGFDQDYRRGETFYRAHNAAGYRLEVEYAGFQVMTVSLNKPR